MIRVLVIGDWWLEIGEWGPAPRIRGTRFRVVAAPTQVGVETQTRGLVNGEWEEVAI